MRLAITSWWLAAGIVFAGGGVLWAGTEGSSGESAAVSRPSFIIENLPVGNSKKASRQILNVAGVNVFRKSPFNGDTVRLDFDKIPARFYRSKKLHIVFSSAPEADFFEKLLEKGDSYDLVIGYAYIPRLAPVDPKDVWMLSKATGEKQRLADVIADAKKNGAIPEAPPTPGRRNCIDPGSEMLNQWPALFLSNN